MSYSSRLITPSLINSFNWYNNCPPNWKDKAICDLTNYLNREPFEPNEYFERGDKYEKQVQQMCRGLRVDEPMETAAEMAKLCAGGRWQQRIKTFVDIDHQSYCIYGRIDVLKPEEIIDIKTTSKFKGEDSYLSGSQHIFYLYATHANRMPQQVFKYLVTDFQKIYQIKFEVDDWDLLRVEALRLIQDFLLFLKDHPDLEDAYINKFCY